MKSFFSPTLPLETKSIRWKVKLLQTTCLAKVLKLKQKPVRLMLHTGHVASADHSNYHAAASKSARSAELVA